MGAKDRLKTALRLPPCPIYDVEGTESWLADMAREGLHLCRAEVARLERCLRDAGLEKPSPAPERGKEAASWVPRTV